MKVSHLVVTTAVLAGLTGVGVWQRDFIGEKLKKINMPDFHFSQRATRVKKKKRIEEARQQRKKALAYATKLFARRFKKHLKKRYHESTIVKVSSFNYRPEESSGKLTQGYEIHIDVSSIKNVNSRYQFKGELVRELAAVVRTLQSMKGKRRKYRFNMFFKGTSLIRGGMTPKQMSKWQLYDYSEKALFEKLGDTILENTEYFSKKHAEP